MFFLGGGDLVYGFLWTVFYRTVKTEPLVTRMVVCLRFYLFPSFVSLREIPLPGFKLLTQKICHIPPREFPHLLHRYNAFGGART